MAEKGRRSPTSSSRSGYGCAQLSVLRPSVSWIRAPVRSERPWVFVFDGPCDPSAPFDSAYAFCSAKSLSFSGRGPFRKSRRRRAYFGNPPQVYRFAGCGCNLSASDALPAFPSRGTLYWRIHCGIRSPATNDGAQDGNGRGIPRSICVHVFPRIMRRCPAKKSRW